MGHNIERRSLGINSPEEAANKEFHVGLENPEPSEVVLFETGTKPSLQCDSKTRSVVVNGIRKDLAPTEYRLLRTLKGGQGMIVSNHELRSGLAGPGKPQASSDSLRFWIHRLDRKLQNPEGFKFIKNLKGVGYRFNTTPSETERTKGEEYCLRGGRIFYPENSSIKIDGKENYLTNTENILLLLLARNLDRVVSRERLIDGAWRKKDTHRRDTESLLIQYIQRLRHKLEDQKKEEERNFTILQNVYRVGYKLRP